MLKAKSTMKNYSMMKKIIILLFIGTAFIFGSCDDSEDVTPSLADRDRMDTLFDASLPELVAFKETYGTYVLYRFDQLLDFAYQFEEAENWRNARITYLEKEEIGTAFAFLQQHFISCYRDTIMVDGGEKITNLKKEYFPRKFLICSKIQSSSTLGLSEPVARFHSAVANVNSFTVAGLDQASLSALTDTELKAYVQQLHYIYLAGYVVNSRRNLFVPDAFYDSGSKLYGSKIDRTGTLDESYFMNRGFFFIEVGENYYPQQVDDLQIYIKNAINLNERMKDKIATHSLVYNKMVFLVKALAGIGVDVARINPLLTEYLN